MAGFNGGYIQGHTGAEPKASVFDVIVAPGGAGDYTLLSAACAAEGAGTVIGLAPGAYTEIADVVMKAGQTVTCFGYPDDGTVYDMAEYEFQMAGENRVEGFHVMGGATGGAPYGTTLFYFDGDYCVIKDMQVEMDATQSMYIFESPLADGHILDNIQIINTDPTVYHQVIRFGVGPGRADRCFINDIFIDDFRCNAAGAATLVILDGNYCDVDGITIRLDNGQTAQNQYCIIFDGSYSRYDNISINNPTAVASSPHGIDFQSGNSVLSNLTLDRLGTAIYITGSDSSVASFSITANEGIRLDSATSISISNGYISAGDYGITDESGQSYITTISDVSVINGSGGAIGIDIEGDLWAVGDCYIRGGGATGRAALIVGNENHFVNIKSDDDANSGYFEITGNRNRLQDVDYYTLNDAGVYTKINGLYQTTGAPGAGDDVADGFMEGDRWHDTNTNKVYECYDATLAAAVWTEVGVGSLGYTLVNVTDGDTPYSVTSGEWCENSGAGGDCTILLPTAVAGLKVKFTIAEDTHAYVVTAAAGDQLHVGGNSSSVAGTCTFEDAFAEIEFIAINDTDWVASFASGGPFTLA